MALNKRPDDFFPSDTHILADSGTPLTTWCMARGVGAGRPQEDHDMDDRISKGRGGIERAFGITKARFRCFRGKTGVQFYSAPASAGGFTAAEKYRMAWIFSCIMHNFCVDFRVRHSLTYDSSFQDALEKDADVIIREYNEIPRLIVNDDDDEPTVPVGETPAEKKARLFRTATQ